MKTLDLADVGRLPEELKAGEEIELRDGKRAVAKVVPIETLEEGTETGKLPDDFFTRPLPSANASVLEALLEERRTGR